ncbi:MAG: single-stranded DNA-binding protein [Gammaproteobacteria bacterium]|jgi:single-strand DNA-binding protein|nr:single-stranded DNA-binding protein [Gammaproteobacteria bacterium]NBT44078.1 single-stranded DNA-binding protein [Gammaproteobacteria bacterium]NBY21352.1 single-stranded DNA-binding protein [Gammaproteobacteria bacterium]
MLNRAELIGRLGRDPEVRYTTEGKAIANLAMATSEFFRDRDSGQRKEQTEWHRVVLFGKQAEIAGKYLKKGALAYVDGRLRTRKWKNRQGQEQFTTELVGNSLTLLEKKGQGSGVDSSLSEADSIGNREDGFFDFPDMPF